MTEPDDPDDLPEWVRDDAADVADLLDLPADAALRLTVERATMWYGWPLPEEDPKREKKRATAAQFTEVMDADRFEPAGGGA